MILCDANVWLALTLSGHVHHIPAREWLDSIDAAGSIAFCRATQQTFLRLLTNEAVLAPYGRGPLTNLEAWAVYHAFIDDDRIGLRRDEPAGLDAVWEQFSARKSASPKLWMDSYLAAFALSGRLRLVTTDAGFRQFRDLDPVILGGAREPAG